MNENQPGTVDTLREERFVETDAAAFVFLSKEESNRIRERAKRSQEARAAGREETVAP